MFAFIVAVRFALLPWNCDTVWMFLCPGVVFTNGSFDAFLIGLFPFPIEELPRPSLVLGSGLSPYVFDIYMDDGVGWILNWPVFICLRPP